MRYILRSAVVLQGCPGCPYHRLLAYVVRVAAHVSRHTFDVKDGLTTEDRAELQRLRRENKQLKLEREI